MLRSPMPHFVGELSAKSPHLAKDARHGAPSVVVPMLGRVRAAKSKADSSLLPSVACRNDKFEMAIEAKGGFGWAGTLCWGAFGEIPTSRKRCETWGTLGGCPHVVEGEGGEVKSRFLVAPFGRVSE